MTAPKVALVIPARNKAQHIAKAIESALAQTYRGLSIVISDQGSTDGTKDAIRGVLEGRQHNHHIVVYDCPDRTRYGLAGLNAHLRWIHKAVDADIFLTLGADDLNMPTRVERVVAAFESTGASYVGTHHIFAAPDQGMPSPGGTYQQTIWPKETGFVDPSQLFTQRVGGSCSCAWRRDLFEEFPLVDDVIPDLWLPYFATCRDGMFVIAEPLAVHVKHEDLGNAGLEGVLRATTDPLGRQVLEERIWCDISRTLARIFHRASQMDEKGWPSPARQGLWSGIIEHALGWSAARHKLDDMRRDEAKEAA